MSQGYFSVSSRYGKKTEEEKEKLRIQMAEYYYKRTEGKVKRRKQPLKFTEKFGLKNRNNILKKWYRWEQEKLRVYQFHYLK